MNARDELARAIYDASEEEAPYSEVEDQALEIAKKLIAAGYRKPRTVTTAEELDALPVGSVVMTQGRAHYRVCIGTVPYVGVGWESTRSRGGWRSEDIPLPATVLREGSPE